MVFVVGKRVIRERGDVENRRGELEEIRRSLVKGSNGEVKERGGMLLGVGGVVKIEGRSDVKEESRRGRRMFEIDEIVG